MAETSSSYPIKAHMEFLCSMNHYSYLLTSDIPEPRFVLCNRLVEEISGLIPYTFLIWATAYSDFRFTNYKGADLEKWLILKQIWHGSTSRNVKEGVRILLSGALASASLNVKISPIAVKIPLRNFLG